jgi:diguanylate cyclase (GGDEF)-like protein/PAS domain S-box-containing protein
MTDQNLGLVERGHPMGYAEIRNCPARIFLYLCAMLNINRKRRLYNIDAIVILIIEAVVTMELSPARAHILVITNDAGAARRISDFCTGFSNGRFAVERAPSLSESLDWLTKRNITLVILDLTLPDSNGIDTFDKTAIFAPGIPILILCTSEEEYIAKEAVRRGAQNYLIKDLANNDSLFRALRSLSALQLAAGVLLDDNARAKATLDSIGYAVLSTDRGWKITYLNTVAEKMTGWTLKEAVAKPLEEVLEIIDRKSREPVRNPLELAIQQDRAVSLAADSILISRDGQETGIEDSAAPIRDLDGEVLGAVLVFHDAGKAQHDALTGLPNRTLLNDRLTQGIRIDQRSRKKLAVLFVDLDLFKPFNDSLGHLAGDELLRVVAGRLRGALREADSVCRYGGDEFVIVLPDIGGAVEASNVARKLINRLALPLFIDRGEFHITASIGISIYPDHGKNADSLIRSADLAMYEAKKSGGDAFSLCCLDLAMS